MLQDLDPIAFCAMSAPGESGFRLYRITANSIHTPAIRLGQLALLSTRPRAALAEATAQIALPVRLQPWIPEESAGIISMFLGKLRMFANLDSRP